MEYIITWIIHLLITYLNIVSLSTEHPEMPDNN